MADPPFLQLFVLPVAEAGRRREGIIDVYTPLEHDRLARPAIVFIHGGPLPPRAAAQAPGLAGVHRLRLLGRQPRDGRRRRRSPAAFTGRLRDCGRRRCLRGAQARALDEVDPNRVALWFFSGGGLLSADWLAQPPAWLRCIAATYPLLAPLAGWDVDARFRPVEAV